MTKKEHLLIKLAEEGVEVALELSKVSHKTLLFGCDEVCVINPEGPSNIQRVVAELNDLYAVAEMLVDAGVLASTWFDPDRVAAKKAKVEKFMEHARKCGVLEPPPPPRYNPPNPYPMR